MKIVHVKNYEKRKKSLTMALSAFAAYLDVPGVRLKLTPRGFLMVQPIRKAAKCSR